MNRRLRDFVSGVMGSGKQPLLQDDFSAALSAEVWTARAGTWETSAGKARAATLGNANDIISNAEFSSTTDPWAASSAVIAIARLDFATAPAIGPTGGSDNFGLEVKSVSSSGYAMLVSLPTLVGVPYTMSCRAYSPSANAEVNSARLQVTIGGVLAATIAVEDAWATLSLADMVAAATTGDIQLWNLSATAGDLAFFDAVHAYAQLGMITCDPAATDIDIRVKFTTPASGVRPFGVVARYQDINNYWLWWIMPGTAGNDCILYQVEAGVFTSRASADIDWAVSTEYALKLTISGNDYTAYVDGVSKLAYTDATGFLNDKTPCGLVDANTANGLADDWTVYPLI